jgi:predicted membrane chloride channel (bestrophin family)
MADDEDVKLFVECINRWAEDTDLRLRELEQRDYIDRNMIETLIEKINDLNQRLRRLERWKSEWLF